MKKSKLSIIKLWKYLFSWRKLKTKLENAIDDEKVTTIIDQLFFGLNTDETLALSKKVKIAFDKKLEARKIEAVLIEQSISNYYTEA